MFSAFLTLCFYSANDVTSKWYYTTLSVISFKILNGFITLLYHVLCDNIKYCTCAVAGGISLTDVWDLSSAAAFMELTTVYNHSAVITRFCARLSSPVTAYKEMKRHHFCTLLFCCWVISRIDTVNILWWFSSFTGGGKPQMPLRAYFGHLSRTTDVPYAG